MPLTLQSADLLHFRQATEAMLSPLSYGSLSSWCSAVLGEVGALLGSDRSLMGVPDGDDFLTYSETLPASALDVFRGFTRVREPGAIRIPEHPQVDAAFQVRRAMGIEVWSNAMLERAHGVPMENASLYHDVLRPAGVLHGYGVSIPLPLGEGFMNLAHTRPDADRWGEAGCLELLSMLLPAFKAGVRSLVRLQEHRESLVRGLDGLGQAVLVCDPDGRDVHRTPALKRLVRGDEGDEVIEAMRSEAHRLAALRRTGRSKGHGPALPAGERTLRLGGRTLRLRATYMPDDAWPGGGAILVALDLPAHLPSLERLMGAEGLTRRQAEIALLLARGGSNREIADRLCISPNTVRTHAEHVFARLGVHSRKALALRLMKGPDGIPAEPD